MRLLLFTAVICLAFLTLADVLPAPAGYGLLVAALVWIVLIEHERHKKSEHIKKRRSHYKARWAVYVRHLSGLPLPADTAAILLFTGREFILETENDSWSLASDNLHNLLLATGEQLRKKSDQQLCRQLDIEDCIFLALRERMRRREKNSGRCGFLFLAAKEHSVWVFVASGRWQLLVNLLKAGGLAEKIHYMID